MDERRLDTGQVLAAGILEARSPVTDIPSDREALTVDAWERLDLQSLIDAVEAGQLLTCCEYYLCSNRCDDLRAHIFDDGNCFRFHFCTTRR